MTLTAEGGCATERRFHAKRIEVPIDHRIGREDGRFDFKKSPIVEKMPQSPQQIGPELKVLPTGGWTKVDILGGVEHTPVRKVVERAVEEVA
jgi:hypothetical protein